MKNYVSPLSHILKKKKHGCYNSVPYVRKKPRSLAYLTGSQAPPPARLTVTQKLIAFLVHEFADIWDLEKPSSESHEINVQTEKKRMQNIPCRTKPCIFLRVSLCSGEEIMRYFFPLFFAEFQGMAAAAAAAAADEYSAAAAAPPPPPRYIPN